jgi:hypothetical protein
MTARTTHDRTEGLWLAVSVILILVAALYPYLLAAFGTPPGYHFWGATWFAPDDGLLLSVMWEGVRGHWLHTPPYALADGPGALFYPGYVLLGHLSRRTGLDPVVVFYLARFACGAILLVSLHGFVGRFFDRREDRRFAFLVAATGGGLGWLAATGFQLRNVEFSAPEAYPFFSILASAHFPLAAAALLWVLDALVPGTHGSPSETAVRAPDSACWVRFVAGVVILALMQPFGSVVAFCLGAFCASARWARERRLPRAELVGLTVLATFTAMVVPHQITTIASNPAFVGWRTQVRTPMPPPGQLLLAIGLVLPFAILGLVDAARRRRPGDLLLLGWIGTLAVLLSLPYYQARRFDLAGYVPLAILAVRGVGTLRFRWSDGDRSLAVLLNALSSILLVLGTTGRISGLDPELFMREERWAAIRYLRDRAPERAGVLAEPVTSLSLLASSPLRVVYGHPTENPRAAETRRAVQGFFDSGRALDAGLMSRVDYVLVERRAKAPRPPIPPEFRRVFVRGNVSVYERRR